jgi:addiction module RelE/StbE family toxin
MPKNSKFTVYWTETAQKDLLGIIDYISKDNVERAQKVFEKLKKESEELDNFPYRGRIVPELKYHNIESYRELIISPWRMIYRIEGKKVFILAIFDSSRNFEDILLDRFMKR